MSRCFPFPPPGYEKKPIIDDPDLLTKEKRREKKHKKDKKDKEKKDSKEKREKDRNEGRHKEKKDKHRDKKKEKEKSKTSTPDGINIYAQSNGYNGESLHHNNSANVKKPSMQFPHQNGDLRRNKIMVGDTENYKFVQELDRRIRDDEKGTGSHQFVVEGRKNNVNKFEMQKTDGLQVMMDAAGFSGYVAVSNRVNGATTSPLDIRRIEKIKKEKKVEKLKEYTEQKKAERSKDKHIIRSDVVAVASNSFTHLLDNGFLGVGNEGNAKKRKDMEANGVSHENELRPNKMARPVSNISPGNNGRKLDFPHSPGPTLFDMQGASQNSFKVGQRVNGLTSQKPPIPASYNVTSKPSPIKSPPVITNHVTAQLSTPKTPPSIPNLIASYNQLPSLSSPPPPPPTTRKQQPISKKKPPHPDTRYLNQILSVPKPDQWCSFVDQEWLRSSKGGPTSKNGSKTDDLDVQVWSEAKHIESVGVCALPYVIPY